MSVLITADSMGDEETTPKPRLHLLPCEIQHNGSANVSQFFEASIRERFEGDPTSQMTASFRGRPLIGQNISVPSGYKGVVLRECPTQDEEDRKVRVTERFDEFTYWNLDQIPSEDDTIQQALLWLDMAKVLHKPLNEEDSQKSLVGK